MGRIVYAGICMFISGFIAGTLVQAKFHIFLPQQVSVEDAPSLSALINSRCGSLFKAGKLEKFDDCQDEVADGYQLAYGSIPDGK